MTQQKKWGKEDLAKIIGKNAYKKVQTIENNKSCHQTAPTITSKTV